MQDYKHCYVQKRDNTKEIFSIEKINKILTWATEDLENVSISDIEVNAKLNIRDGITTEEIHKVLIFTTANLISIENSDYQYVASRLLNYQLRKDVWGGKNAPKLLDLIKNNIKKEMYDPDILTWYSEKEINKIDEFINHTRDLNLTYAATKQLCDKYLVKDVIDNIFYETPQFRYIVAGLTIFQKYVGNKRLEYVKKFYNYVSKNKINLSTPVLGKLGTKDRSYASCCLIEFNDTKESIDAMIQATGAATYNSYGVGVNFGRMRSIKSPIKHGRIVHPGVIPFLKTVEANVKSWQQNAARGGGGTINFPIFNYEIEDIIKLKDMKTGTHDNRVPHLDYSISISKLFYERFLKNENITLFSTHDTPNLYESFGQPEFDALYKKYENDENVKFKKVVSARELFSNIVREMINTGRIYILNIDNVNQHGSWNEPVYMSNLCQEVLQNIDPIKSINDTNGEIGVCILSAVNWLETKENELEKVCDVIVRMLDEIIDIQDYFSLSAKNFAQNKRSLGVGVTNLAAYLAYNEVKYSDNSALQLVNLYMEKQQYYLIKSSIELAKEKGICNKFNTSKYSKGLLPIDWKKRDSELINKFNLAMDWEELRNSIKESGMRHTTLTCCMPVESSSVTQNATNGVEPVRKLFTYKGSKKSSIPLIVPSAKKLLENYELAFLRKDNIGYLNICGVLQKWVDMGISVNLYYNPENYPDKKIPYSQVLSEILHHYKNGGKTIYYTNTDDGNVHFEKVEEKTESTCSGGSCTL